MDTAPPPQLPPPAAPAPSPPAPALLAAWPRSAQVTTAFLLGVAVTLLLVQALGLLRWGSRPTELERGSTYRIDLNRATRAELLQVPGVGPALVDRIEEHRRERGGFRSVEDLAEVRGIGPATLARVRPWVCVTLEEDGTVPALAPLKKTASSGDTSGQRSGAKKEPDPANPLDLNQATLEELQRLPGVGPVLSQRIIEARSRAPFKSVEDLRRVSGIGKKTLEKLRPYIRVGSESRSVVAVD